MISEVVNTLFLTYLASEYLVADELPSNRRNAVSSTIKSKWLIVAVGVVALINVLDLMSGAQEIANNAFEGFLHLPRILFAAVAYILALYWDVRRRVHLTTQQFATKVGWAFCKVLPAYPFMAVLISFGFLFVVSLWEALNLPLEWLNWPIYYGTLYGPFAWVYVHVKRQVCEEASSLPV